MDWSIIEMRWREFRVSAKREWDKLSEEAERQVAGWQGRQFDRRSSAANSA